jgi:hypothetical protein
MARLSLNSEYVAPLVDAGFCRHVVRGLLEFEVYRRPAEGRWFLQAQIEDDGRVDVGLAQDVGWGTFIGPIHRAGSASALARALPDIVRSLEALAAADYKLRCPRCRSWTVVRSGEGGPILSCAQRRKPRALDDDEEGSQEPPCGGTLPLRALHVHGEASAGGAPPITAEPSR